MVYFPGRLVGRETETAKMAGLAGAAKAGTGQVAFVVGEAGLGKTALLELTTETARSLGMQVLHAAAQELERQRPFAVISACLGVDTQSADASLARAGEILRGEGRYGMPGGTGDEAESDFAAVETMLNLIDDLCTQQPLALFLDDLQWADSASLLVVQRLLRSIHQLPLLLVGAYRPLPQGEVDRLSLSLTLGTRTMLELTALSPPAVSALLAGLCGGAPGPRLRRMAEGAAGNPLYVMELAAALQREDAIDLHDGLAEVSVDCRAPSLNHLITHRLRYLREEVLQALRAASVLGASCTLTDLSAVLDRSAHELLSIVAEAETAGILRDAGDRLFFRHDLIRHALYDAVPGSARAMLHLRTAQALARAGAVPEQVAEHLLVAAPASGDFLIDWILGSAVPLTSRVPAMALLLIDQALALADPTDPRRGQLQLYRAVAQLSSGRLAEAEETARCSLARTRAPGWEGPLRWVIVHASFARGRPDLALVEIRAACGRPGVPALEVIRLRAFSAVCLFALGRLPEAGAVASAVRRAAEGMDDDAALADALHVLAAKRFLEAPSTEALELARHSARLMPEPLHPAQRTRLQLTLVNRYMDLDRQQDAQRTLAAVHETTEHTGGVYLPWYHLSRALLAFHAGRWDDALTEIEAGLDPGEHFRMCRELRAVAALISLHRGRQSVAEAHLTAAAAAPDSGNITWFYDYLPLCAEALADEARGHPERAYARLTTAFDRGLGQLPGQLTLGLLAPDLVRLALTHNDSTNARRYAEAARRRADHSGAPYHLGAAFRCQGLLARDPDLLLEAARCYHQAPRPLSEAHAYTDAAELLAQQRRPAQARALLEQALEIYTRLDAQWDVARALTRLRAHAVHRSARRPRSSARHGWEALTDTEHIVAGHVASGHSNPEIAARMYISRRTVGSHVSHILQKLGMTSRVELAAEVIRRRSLEEPPLPD
ncbi:AAA family ATPase [Streptomyces platensis]|uniref:helix-turn-helix transcriptional regulator n=1 Tax=Streptomyces platensis TaxID=58346 RepID=UPI0022556C17|nr:LuxR family transcriptional regulator [Streptomyces platensis]MCX4640385.1 AAA family ATPase [Streptomyces platensis]